MTAAWLGPLADFIAANLPWGGEGAPWHHMSITAYERGIALLCAVGAAEEVRGGFAPLPRPWSPKLVLRHDDAAVVALSMLHQAGALSYEDQDAPQLRYIAPRSGMGPVWVDEDGLDLLAALGLIRGGLWTSGAERAMLRIQPLAWGLDARTDAGLQGIIRGAMESMPANIARQVSGILIDTADVRARETVCLIRIRRLVSECWRPDGGWMDQKEARKTFAVPCDPLARQVAKAIIDGETGRK